MLVDSLTPELIKRFFPSAFYQRGLDYYHKGKVFSAKITKIKKGDFITAIVIGSLNKRYLVEIEITGMINKLRIRGECSCPMELNCKHVIATLLHVMDAAIKNRPKEIVTKSKVENSLITAWLKKLKNVSAETQIINKKNIHSVYQLHYILQPVAHQPNDLQLKLQLVAHLKSGKLGHTKLFNDQNSLHRSYLSSLDQELLIKFEVTNKFSATYYYSNFCLKGPAFEKLILEMIATNRLHWLSPEQAPLHVSSAKKMQLEWQMDEDHFQELKPVFADTEDQLLVFQIDQLWYINPATSEMGLIETELAPHVTKLLMSSPKLSPEDVTQVAQQLKNDNQLISLQQPKLFQQIEKRFLDPVCCLRLFETSIEIQENVKNNIKRSVETVPVAALTFRYENIEVSWNDERPVLSQLQDEKIIRFFRKKSLEEAAFQTLLNYNAVLLDMFLNLRDIPANASSLQYFLIQHPECDPLEFSYKVVPLLRDEGWQIDIDKNYSYQIIEEPIEEWYSEINEKAEYDWFSLELGIMIKGEKINLLPVLQKVLKDLGPNYKTEFKKLNQILVELADGRFIPLPFERLRNIVTVLIELYDSESLTDDTLHLSTLHAARLAELEAAFGAASLRWYGGERLRQLAEKLKQFSGIQSVNLPDNFKGVLRPYQQEGLNWLQFLREYNFGGILADDMGLGKTIQALAYLAIENEEGRLNHPCLVIAPTSLMFNWYEESQRFVPHLKTLVLHGQNRKNYFATLADYDLVLTTYPLLVYDKAILLNQDFHLLILDEAQNIKNSKNISAQIVQQIKAKHRFCLTGTPLENHLGELWSLFHFMMPGLLGDDKKFNRLFRTPIEKHGDEERREQLIRRIAPFLLRRTKDKVAHDLPAKVPIVQHIEIEETQRDLYETIRVTMQKKVRAEIAKMGLARSHIIILDALLKLRQVCCDPRLLKIDSLKKTRAKSAKLEFLMSLVPELLDEGRRILLFSQFTSMLELIEDELKLKKINYVKLTGQTRNRADVIRQFQEGKASLFLISLKAGGTGLNLTTADTVIHYDPWWNPAVEDQATDRAHRIGQLKTVFVYKLVMKGTIEEKILEMQQHKRTLMESLFSDKTTGKLTLSEADLQTLFEPLVF